jgi:hypothetical protein
MMITLRPKPRKRSGRSGIKKPQIRRKEVIETNLLQKTEKKEEGQEAKLEINRLQKQKQQHHLLLVAMIKVTMILLVAMIKVTMIKMRTKRR